MSAESNTLEPYRGEFRYLFFSPVDRYESTVEFYRDVLELPVIAEFGDSESQSRRADFQASVGVIEVAMNRGDSELKSIMLKPGEEYRAAVGGYLLFEVEDVDRLYQHVVEKGADVVQEVKDWYWRFRDFKVKDPCGNIVCVCSRLPGWEKYH